MVYSEVRTSLPTLTVEDDLTASVVVAMVSDQHPLVLAAASTPPLPARQFARQLSLSDRAVADDVAAAVATAYSQTGRSP